MMNSRPNTPWFNQLDAGQRAQLHALLARCRFPTQGPVVCAVSGGADSLCLLILARAAGLDVSAVHVDHQLRENSASEANVVADACALVGATFQSVTVTVGPGGNLEARARAARHAALPAGCLYGHTADDRAETMLLNLTRGSGPAGLAALGPHPKRPILNLRRADTETVARMLPFAYVTDESNHDQRFRRNRMRHELLPLMNDIAQRDITPLLARLGDQLADVIGLLDSLAANIDPASCAQLNAAAKPVAQHALRQWLREGRDEHHPPDAACIQRVLDVAAGRARACDIGDGRRLARSRGRLRIIPADPQRSARG